MNARILATLALLASCSLSVGCSGGPEDTKIAVPANAIVESVRSTLESMKKSGQKGSAMSALETDINGIKSSDKAKGEALAKLYVELDAAPTPEKVKEKAAEMLGKL